MMIDHYFMGGGIYEENSFQTDTLLLETFEYQLLVVLKGDLAIAIGIGHLNPNRHILLRGFITHAHLFISLFQKQRNLNW